MCGSVGQIPEHVASLRLSDHPISRSGIPRDSGDPPLPVNRLKSKQIPRCASGFRLRAPAPLTPANRLNSADPSLRFGISLAGSRSAHARKPAQLCRSLAALRDFACGLPLRSRPQTGSTLQIPRSASGFRLRAPAPLTPANRLNSADPSLRFGISPAGSRSAHARKPAQFVIA